jgi:hypothetical protein
MAELDAQAAIEEAQNKSSLTAGTEVNDDWLWLRSIHGHDYRIGSYLNRRNDHEKASILDGILRGSARLVRAEHAGAGSGLSDLSIGRR